MVRLDRRAGERLPVPQLVILLTDTNTHGSSEQRCSGGRRHVPGRASLNCSLL